MYLVPFFQVLLKDEDLTCKQDALVAFQALSNAAVVADRLSLKTIVNFFNRQCHSDVISAATGLLDLMFEGEAVSLNDLLETEALEAAINLLNTNRQSLGSDKGARALLKIAQEHEVARHRIASAQLDGLGGLKILMNYVNSFGSSGLKDALATTLVSFCKSGETCEVYFALLTIVPALVMEIFMQTAGCLWKPVFGISFL
jgi:hypothetical protein